MADKSVLESLQASIAAIENQGFGNPSKASKKHVQSRGSNGKRASSDLTDEQGAFKKVVALLNAGDKSELKLRERLAKDGFDESSADQAIERAKGYGYVDDERFADTLIRSRLSQGKGSVGLARELAENGIDIDTVPGWPHEYPVSQEEEFQRALDLLKRKPPRSKNARNAAYRKLMQKGYSSSIASSASRTWCEQVV